MSSKKYFSSSDIHSHYEEWMIALSKKGFDLTDKNHIVIICGDLFDRGLHSVECFNFVKQLAEEGRLIYIRGNHEDLLFDCVKALTRGGSIGHHHISNGTIRTIAQFLNCSEYDILCYVYENYQLEEFKEKVLNFIDDNCVDYFELGDKVFVHGWVPTTSDNAGYCIVHENWRDGSWSEARWACGFDDWRCKLVPEGKTVVCGHWHTSYGWSRFRGLTEWGPDACFDTFIDNGIIALDACTVYTKTVNVIVFDEKGNIVEENYAKN